MNDWQPIESAPKDGTRVLLWLPDCLSLPNLDRCSGEAVAARFITEFKINGGWVVCGYIEKRLLRKRKLRVVTAGNPTLWQPLPAPPTA